MEHIKLHPKLDGQEHVVEFDFLGKDSIRYYNKVSVEKPVSVAEMGVVAGVVQGGFGSLGGGPKSTSETCFNPTVTAHARVLWDKDTHVDPSLEKRVEALGYGFQGCFSP